MKNNCEYCDTNSDHCLVFYEQPTDEWYLDVQTEEWDSYDDDFVHQRVYINYCPYCGRSLYAQSEPKTCRRCKNISVDEKTSSIICSLTGKELSEEKVQELHTCCEVN